MRRIRSLESFIMSPWHSVVRNVSCSVSMWHSCIWNISTGHWYHWIRAECRAVQNVEPLRCVALNTIIPLGIGILRNATQRKYLQWEKHFKFIRVQLTTTQHCLRYSAPNLYLNQCWPDSTTHIGGTRGRWVKFGWLLPAEKRGIQWEEFDPWSRL